VLWVIYQIIMALQSVADFALEKKFTEQDDSTRASLHIARFVINFIIWSLGLILALSNIGIDVTSLVAGLGIGGIAVALAAQNVLGDLFSSFALHFDKPFVVGDFIIIGSDLGTVKKIGIRTTRIATLRGEELVVSNKELTSTRIMNFKQMKDRRVVSVIKVENTIDRDKLKAIPGWYRSIIEKIPDARFDRSHFCNFGESWLEIETVYYVLSPDYNLYMDIQQKINLAILEKLDDEDVSLAVPSRVMYTRKG
ncbi:MAG: mechanosensitive ion channel family protein, partial [Candidatus Paceibacterota bacterium]